MVLRVNHRFFQGASAIERYTLSLHDALPISPGPSARWPAAAEGSVRAREHPDDVAGGFHPPMPPVVPGPWGCDRPPAPGPAPVRLPTCSAPAVPPVRRGPARGWTAPTTLRSGPRPGAPPQPPVLNGSAVRSAPHRYVR